MCMFLKVMRKFYKKLNAKKMFKKAKKNINELDSSQYNEEEQEVNDTFHNFIKYFSHFVQGKNTVGHQTNMSHPRYKSIGSVLTFQIQLS